MASPTYYCSSNTQIPEEKFWNENKVVQHRNTDYKTKLNNPGNLRNLRLSFNSSSPGEDRRVRYCYEWQVPHHISANCLIRISEVKERKTPLHGLLYELKFKVTNNKPLTSASEIFSIYPGDAANQTIDNTIPMVSFSCEANNKTYMHWNETTKEIGRLTNFLDRWHHIRIIMDNANDQVSVILDDSMIFENIPGSPMAVFSPAVSFASGPNHSTTIEIDDVIVQALYTQEESITGNSSSSPRPYALGPRPLFTEDFERLNEKNSLENNGWRTKNEQIIEDQENQSRKSVFVNLNPALASKTLKMQTIPGNRVIAVKHFDIPMDFPFDVSDNPFEIRYNNDMNNDTEVHEPGDIYPGFGGHGTSGNYSYSAPAATSSNRKTTPSRVQDTTLVDTYYIYSYDGKLLAEYDHNGNCVKDYIYAGNRLIAEYYPPPIDKYYYYMPDQVNSIRIVTDGNGDVVYSAAYGPYGEVEKVWNNTYEPKLKFSGKERDEYTDLDYFGARYYNHSHYRFNSVDPVINKGEALYNPQVWNLYAYCRNNPITYSDPNGMEPNKSQVIAPNSLISYINNAPGSTARAKLAWLGTYSTAPGRFGGANPKNKRYIYTEKAGWIDLAHFFGVAAELDKLSGIKRIGAWMFGGFALWQKTKEVENNQAAQGSIGTAWSYEDAPSNYYGWIFWKFYYDPQGSLADQISSFLNNYVGTSPQNAPNWNQMWSKENPYKQQFPQNKSFLPKFTK